MSLLISAILRLGQTISPNPSEEQHVHIAQAPVEKEGIDHLKLISGANVELSDAISFSAQKCAAARAIETERPQARLFEDNLAGVLAGPRAMQLLRQSWESKETEMSPRIAIRTRYFDDFIVESVRDLSQRHDVEERVQVVLLGAGMDTRAYRLSMLRQVAAIFEVDNREVLDLKASLLEGVQPAPVPIGPSPVQVRANLVEDDWPTALTDVGFDPDAVTIWVVEGVLYYLTHVHVTRLLNQVAQLSAPQSRLGFSAISRMEPWKTDGKHASVRGFKSAMPDPESLLQKAGFKTDYIDTFGGRRVNYRRCTEEDVRKGDEWKQRREGIYVLATKV